MVLNFLAAAFQLMPLTVCADIDMKVLRLAAVEESNLKTHAYLTLEVLYASRRFHSNLDHVEQMLKSMLENQEVLSGYRGSTQMMTQGEHEEMRVIAYIQSTTQVILNLATAQGVRGSDVLRYISTCFSVFCEYFQNTTARIRNAAYSALRMILSQGLKREFFNEKQNQVQSSTDVLLLDAMSMDEEVSNIRKGASSTR
jgi:hypothetical protein